MTPSPSPPHRPDPDHSTAQRVIKKRRTRGFISCEQCQKRKSRCELLNREGCHRCRVLDTPCSLALAPVDATLSKPSASTSSIPPALSAIAMYPYDSHQPFSAMPGISSSSNPDSEGPAERPVSLGIEATSSFPKTSTNSAPLAPTLSQGWMYRIENMLKRVLDEAQLRTGHSPESSFSTSGATRLGDRPDGVGDGDDIEDAVKGLLSTSIGPCLLVASGVNVHDRSSFLCPVAEGLVSAQDFCVAYMTFCNTFNTIIPIQRLIPPLGAFTDPFLRGCMLDYVDSANRTPSPPTAYSRRLASLLSHNLAQIPCANPTLSIILGLLILSLRPLKTGDLRFARKMDEEGFIGRAMEFAVAYGLEDSALRASKETMKDLLSDSFGPLMDHTLLWFCVVHRAAFVDVFSSPSFSTRGIARPGVLDLWGSEPIPNQRLISHLVLEARLMNHIAKVAEAFQRIRIEHFEEVRMRMMMYSLQDFDAGMRTWRAATLHSETPTKGFLILMSHLVQMLFPHKMGTDLRVVVPSPLLHDDIVQTYADLGNQFLLCTRDYISYVVLSGINLTTLPRFLLTPCFTAYHANAVSGRINRDNVYVSTPHVVNFRALLLAAHPLSMQFLQYLDDGIPPVGWKELHGQDVQHFQNVDGTGDVPQTLLEEFMKWIETDFGNNGELSLQAHATTT